jgi:hypothetical protein
MAMVTCGRCGKQAEVADEDGTPSGWTFETERGRVVRYCVECVRDNIRSIEAKLPEEYWER